MAKKVFLGVGHGGKDPGATANGFKEKDLNLAIALACRDELERHGVEVGMSRTKDEDDTLSEEINECNAFKPDLALDIHNNAGGGNGAEAYCSIKGGTDRTLATKVLQEIIKVGQNSRGVKTKKRADGLDYFGFIRCISAPSIIVECAFVDNKADLEIIDTAAEQKIMGIAIAKGILATLGITWKDPTKVEVVAKPVEQPKEMYRVRKTWADAKSQIGAFTILENAKKKADANVGYKVFDSKGVCIYEPKMGIQKGDTVKLKEGAKTYTGGKLASFVYKRKYIVKEVSGERAVITYNGVVVAAVKKSDLTRV